MPLVYINDDWESQITVDPDDFYECEIIATDSINHTVKYVAKSGNRVTATVRHEFFGFSEEQLVSQVVGAHIARLRSDIDEWHAFLTGYMADKAVENFR